MISQELKDPQCRDEMAAARGALKKNATMLYTASQAFLRHPDVAATRANRDYVFKQVQEAIGGISSAAQASSPTDEKHGHAGIGELAAALNEFDVSQKMFLILVSLLSLQVSYSWLMIKAADNQNWNVSTNVEFECSDYRITSSFHRQYNSLPPSSGCLLKVTSLKNGEYCHFFLEH